MTSYNRNYYGNPKTDPVAIEKNRLGVSPSDIPNQKNLPSTYFKTKFSYTLQKRKRPNIQHDKGHLVFPKRAPTLEDKMTLLKWKSMTSVAEAIRPDLTDATAAYNHFLEGKGSTRTFSYERYVSGDESGRKTLENAILHIKLGIEDLWLENNSLRSFCVSGPEIRCGGSNVDKKIFPYPKTENWQKAIGAHSIWLYGDVKVVVDENNYPSFYAIVTLNAEDMYNFNPGANDIATGIPDSENGALTITRLAHPYLNKATLTRSVSWKGFSNKNVSIVSREKGRYERERQSKENRRLRNRV